jgi:ATP-dependent Clp protease protease subunit
MHQPLGSVQGYAVDIAIQAEQFAQARHLMAELTAQHTGQTIERILADGDRDRWFTPDEALEYGMIDEVIGATRL